MITEKVQNLFDFIDWLHSKADYLLSQQHLVDEVDDIRAEQNKLSPTKHFKDKAEYDRLQHLFLEKLSLIEANIIAPIKEKIEFYDIADIRTPIVNLNALGDLLELQRNYNEQDLLKIQKAKNQYIIYRIKTQRQPYFSFQSFFFELDRQLYEYFKFFEEENEVEYISNKVVNADSLEEAVLLLTGRENLINKPEDTTDSLSNLICHEKGPEIVENIKVRFKNIQGKRLKLLLISLQNLDLLPKDRIGAKFHKLCEAEFNWNVGSYNAMNKYDINDVYDKPEIDEMTEYLKTIINQ